MLVAQIKADKSGWESLQKYHLVQNQETLYQALEHFLTALEVNPKFSDALVGSSLIYYYLGQYPLALQRITSAIAQEPFRIALKEIQVRIFLALDGVIDAEQGAQEILALQPHNIAALISMGDIMLSRNLLQEAKSYYEEALLKDPRSSSALASLAILHRQEGNFIVSQRYIEQALTLTDRHAPIEYQAALSYSQAGDLAKAEEHAREAARLAIPGITEKSLLIQTLAQQGKVTEAITVVDDILAQDPESSLGWYGRGLLAFLDLDIPMALQSFQQSLHVDPHLEPSRFAMERLLIAYYQPFDPLREKAAEYYLVRGNDYMSEYHYPLAEHMYRQGLRLFPFSIALRKALAQLFAIQQDYSNFLDQMELLAQQGEEDVQDIIESYRSYLDDSVSSQWQVSQFSVTRPRYSLSVFVHPNESSPHYPQADISYAWHFLQQIYSTEIASPLPKVFQAKSLGEALQEAIHQQSDYFIRLRFVESARFIVVYAQLYISKNGTLVTEAQSVFSGLDRARIAISRVLDTLLSAIPVRGEILQRTENEVLFSLGSEDGIQPDDELVILAPHQIVLSQDGYEIIGDGLLGTLRVEDTDALISSGNYRQEGSFDRVQVGDYVMRSEVREASALPIATSTSLVYQSMKNFRLVDTDFISKLE